MMRFKKLNKPATIKFMEPTIRYVYYYKNKVEADKCEDKCPLCEAGVPRKILKIVDIK